MSDRINGLTITFDEPVQEETAQRIGDAIILLQHVVSVVPIVQDFMGDYVVRERTKQAIWKKIREAVFSDD